MSIWLRTVALPKRLLKNSAWVTILLPRDAFAKAALQQQYNPELLVKTGLVVNRDEKLVDNYRNRIIFPVHNNTGK